MLRVAVPNKGALAVSASEMLGEAGYRQRHEQRDLTVLDPANEVEFFYLRPKDIPIYVGSGELDLGITGRDLALDSGAPVAETLALGFGEEMPTCKTFARSIATFQADDPTAHHWIWQSGGWLRRCVTSCPTRLSQPTRNRRNRASMNLT